jgi:hypothetical protein
VGFDTRIVHPKPVSVNRFSWKKRDFVGHNIIMPKKSGALCCKITKGKSLTVWGQKEYNSSGNKGVS